MSLKKLLKTASFFILLTISIPASSSVVISPALPASSPAKTENPGVQPLLQRLKEIKAMDMRSMSRLDKKALRKEVKGIKKDLRASGKGIYLSVGAIIIIILLLILLT